jgi:beta-glucosidase
VQFITSLHELVKEGRVPQSRIDDAVRRILRVKMEMGLFEHPFSNLKLMESVGSAKHREVARECVRASLVLLKNEGALPLSKQLKHLAVVGSAADDLGIQCGGWTIDWQGKTGNVTPGGTTILSAIRQAVGPDTEVTFSPDGTGVKSADAVIVVVGEKPYAEMHGDRSDLGLPAEDLALIRQSKSAGAPVVTILLSGRPLIVGPALEASDAFVAAWLPGTEGRGVTDVLFGDSSPTGKSSFAWPKSNDDLVSGVGQSNAKPVFPIGFGLTYATKPSRLVGN